MTSDLENELAPVRHALLDEAVEEAARIMAAAETDARALVDGAHSEVGRAVERARRRAMASATATAEQQLATARRRARADLFRARNEVWDDLVDRVHASAARLVDDPRYPSLESHLLALARDQLGGDIVIERDPGGGFVASAEGRRVDYRMGAVADRALNAVADEAVALWS